MSCPTVRSNTCPSYSASRVGCDGDGCDSLPSPWTCEGRERREPREPQGAALPSGPFQDPSSGSPTRIGLTYPQCHRRPYSSIACARGGYTTTWWSCPALRPSTNITRREAETSLETGFSDRVSISTITLVNIACNRSQDKQVHSDVRGRTVGCERTGGSSP